MPYVAHPSSFRDPDGFLFISEGKLFRAVAHSYEGDYAQLMSSGLYEALLDRGWIVPHHEVSYPLPTGYSRVLLPELLPCINPIVAKILIIPPYKFKLRANLQPYRPRQMEFIVGSVFDAAAKLSQSRMDKGVMNHCI